MSTCRVAVLGFGTVGSAVARRLAFEPPPSLQLAQIFDRRAADHASSLGGLAPGPLRANPGSVSPGVRWTTTIDDVLTGNADIIVEAIGGIEPAEEWIRRALLAGKSVVTPNKQVVARSGLDLLRLAERQGRQFRFEAAVGGAMPIVRAIADGLAGDRLTRIDAILNGTTNAVLSEIDETGCSFDEAIRHAQARGYAEADPSLDLDGDDARAKLAILCALAFGLRVDAAAIPGRSARQATADDFSVARSRNGTIRQIAHAEYDRAASVLTAWVAPRVVPRPSIFGRTTGPNNAAIITGVHAGEIGLFGAGAGGDATSVAIISDLLAIARDRAAIVPAPVTHSAFRIHNSEFQIPHSAFQISPVNSEAAC